MRCDIFNILNFFYVLRFIFSVFFHAALKNGWMNFKALRFWTRVVLRQWHPNSTNTNEYEIYINWIVDPNTYFVKVEQTILAGIVAGNESAFRIFVPLCPNIQSVKPLFNWFADSMHVWITDTTVSGIFPIKASYGKMIAKWIFN